MGPDDIQQWSAKNCLNYMKNCSGGNGNDSAAFQSLILHFFSLYPSLESCRGWLLYQYSPMLSFLPTFPFPHHSWNSLSVTCSHHYIHEITSPLVYVTSPLKADPKACCFSHVLDQHPSNLDSLVWHSWLPKTRYASHTQNMSKSTKLSANWVQAEVIDFLPTFSTFSRRTPRVPLWYLVEEKPTASL